jgi:hypothetical protein
MKIDSRRPNSKESTMNKEKKEFYFFSTIMSFIMSGGMSLTMSLINDNVRLAIEAWPKAWLVSFWVALPLSIIIVPLTERIVKIILKNKR